MKPGRVLLALGLILCLDRAAFAAVRVDLGDAAARPGESTQLTAVLVADAGEEVAAVEIDLSFDPDELAIISRADGRPDCEVEPSIDKGASGFGYRPADCDAAKGRCSRLRAVIVATDNVDAIPDGAVLYRCQVGVAFDVPAGRYMIRGSRAAYAQPDGRERAAGANAATVTVMGVALDTPTPQATATPEPMMTPDAGSGGGGCALRPSDKESKPAPFVWLLALPLLLGMPRSRVFLLGLCSAFFGALSPAAATVRIEIGNIAGVPGATIELSVRLSFDSGEEVAATQNDLHFDPTIAAVVALASGEPDCRVNLAINKMASAFGFRPAGCDPGLSECNAVRAIVLAFDNVDAIADGSVLYTCQLAIKAAVSPGDYMLTGTRTGYAPPVGGDRPAVGGNGLLVVHPAPTATLPATDTPMATTPTPGPTVEPGEPADTNCDGRVDRDDQRAVVAAIFTRAELCNADCNRDGYVTGSDIVCVTHRRVMLASSASDNSLRSLRRPGGRRQNGS